MQDRGDYRYRIPDGLLIDIYRVEIMSPSLPLIGTFKLFVVAYLQYLPSSQSDSCFHLMSVSIVAASTLDPRISCIRYPTQCHCIASSQCPITLYLDTSSKVKVS